MANLLSHAETLVAHGYTLGDIDRIARYIAGEPQWGNADRHDIYIIAHDGAVDVILTAARRPTAGDVCAAGRAAVYQSHRSWKQAFGRRANEPGISPKFCVYWADWIVPACRSRSDAGHADAVVDALALQQILASLPDADAQLIKTLAATASRSRTADVMSISERSIGRRITQARAHAISLWHEGEIPPATPSPPREAMQAQCGTRAGYNAHRRRQENACQDCRDAQASYMRAYNVSRKADGES